MIFLFYRFIDKSCSQHLRPIIFCNLNLYRLLGYFFLCYFVSTEIVPHLLEFRIFFYLFPIVRPLDFYFVLGISQDVSPIFGLKLVLHLSNVFVGIIEDIDRLCYNWCTSLLICWSYTSASLSLTKRKRTSPF